jgi:hypothetical protein
LASLPSVTHLPLTILLVSKRENPSQHCDTTSINLCIETGLRNAH